IAVKTSNGPVIGELHVDAEIGVAHQLDDALQCVAVATADAHQVALDGGLHLQFAVLDLAHDLARLLDGNALLQRDLLLHRGAGRRNERPISQPLQRHLALHQLAFQYLDDGLQLVLIRAGQEDLVVLLVQLDRGLGVLQIVTLLNLLHGLLDGIADLRQLDLGDYVETVIGHRVYRALSAISTFSVISSMIPDMEASRATVTAACTRSGSISATVGPWGGAFGAPMVLVHHRGRKSGREYVNPMMYLPHDTEPDIIYVFATKAGAPTDPDWYRDLTAAGDGSVERGTETYKVTVRELTGAERDRIYAEQARRYPGFAEYARQTAGVRTIPVLELTRA